MPDKHSLAEPESSRYKILPGIAEDSKYFYRNTEEGNSCIGYLRGDFGKHGHEFHHNWFDDDHVRNTPEFKSEFQSIMDVLRQGVLKDLKSTREFCYKHPSARIPGDDQRYAFKLETETRQYFVRCTTLADDYFYVFAYDSKASVLQQLRSDDKTSSKEQTPIPPHGKHKSSHEER